MTIIIIIVLAIAYTTLLSWSLVGLFRSALEHEQFRVGERQFLLDLQAKVIRLQKMADVIFGGRDERE